MNQSKQKIPEHEISELKQLDLASFSAQYGYVLNKEKSVRGKSTVVYKSNDPSDWMVIRKHPQSGDHIYYTGEHDSGNIYTLIEKEEDLPFREAHMKYYVHSVMNQNLSNLKAAESTAEEMTDEVRKEYLSCSELVDTDYLESRGIKAETIFHKKFIDRIFNKVVGEFNNTAFPIYQGSNSIINGLELYNFHYKHTNQSFKASAEKSIKSGGVWMSNFDTFKAIDNIIVTESPIDALSHFQLVNKPKKNNLYISTLGTVTPNNAQTIATIAKASKNSTLVDALDNDKKGNEFGLTLIGAFASITNFNDKNKTTISNVQLSTATKQKQGQVRLDLQHQEADSEQLFQIIEDTVDQANELFRRDYDESAKLKTVLHLEEDNHTIIDIQFSDTKGNWSILKHMMKNMWSVQIKEHKSFFKDWTQDLEVSTGIFKDAPKHKLQSILNNQAPPHFNLSPKAKQDLTKKLNPNKAAL